MKRRTTTARHGQQRSLTPLGQLLKIIGIAAAVVVVSVVGVAAFVVSDLYGSATSDAVDRTPKAT